jgi:hypothetical protein
VGYLDGGVDMAGLDEAGNAYARAARGRVLEAVAWIVEEAGEGRVKAKHAEPTQVLYPLWCANHQPEEESQTRCAHEGSVCQPARKIGVPDDGNISWWIPCLRKRCWSGG